MTIAIPTWLLWTGGAIAALIVLGLAIVGITFLWLTRDGYYR